MAKPAVVRRLPPYRGPAYWEKEQPGEVMTDRIALAYYPKAGKLQISYVFRDQAAGEIRRGKTVTLDFEDVAAHPEVRGLLEKVLEEWK